MKKSPETYEQLGHPLEWVQYADEFLYCSEILYMQKTKMKLTKLDGLGNVIIEKSGISRSYFLLVGFSIENLMKAYIVARKPETLKNGKIDTSISKNHNLIALTKLITTFDFYEDEIKLLEILSEGLPYWTRYPIPKTFENITNEKVISEKTRNTYINLYNRMIIDIYIYFNRESKTWVDTELDKRILDSSNKCNL